MSKMPKWIRAAKSTKRGHPTERWWWEGEVDDETGTSYRRADTVVDKDVAEKMAEVLRGIDQAGSEGEFAEALFKAHAALAAYEEATNREEHQ